MRLKRLDIIGFKSFADRTQIVFDKGVTCVVGPNGCGKSNISDSIRWVLGERSAKMLRGSKMEDVIFNGTQFRKPTAMAEVSLTIDNEDRGLAIDYNEVTITRRLYRSGESEYLLNKTPCRLKDIQDLILDTGIGSNSYSMIEQGRIDYILSADPEERRFLIEEAAGISKFKTKKNEAIRKLERTEDNRLRLNDIIQEVHKNIQYAERQARRAERYKVQFEELKKLEVTKAFLDIDGIETQRGELQTSKTKLSEELQGFESRIQELRSTQEKLSGILRGVLDRFATEDGKRHGLQSKIEQFEQQIRFNQEKRVEMANRKGEIQQETKQLEERIETNKKDIESKKTEVDSLASEKNKALEKLQSSENELNSVQEELAKLRELNDELNAKNTEASSKANLLRSGFHRIEAFLATSQDQKEKWSKEAEQIRGELSAIEQKKASYDAESSRLHQELESLTSSIEQTRSQLEQSKNNSEELKETKILDEKSIHAKQARLAMLTEIEQNLKNKEEEVLKKAPHIDPSSIKSLQHLIKIQPGYEWALELALESFVQSIVLNTEQDAESVIDQIVQQKGTSLSLFIRDFSGDTSQGSTMSAITHPSIECSILQLIEIEPGYEKVFQSFLEHVYVAKEASTRALLNDLLPLATHYKFITKEGVIIGPHHAVHFKSSNVVEEDNVFQRQAEIKELQRSLDEFSSDSSHRETHIQALKTQMTELQEKLESEETRVVDIRIQKESIESLRSNLEDRLQKLQGNLATNQTGAQTFEEDEARSKQQKVELENELREAEGFEAQIRKQIEELGSQRDTIDHKKADILAVVAQNKATYENLDERNRLLEESLSYLLEHEKTDQERIATLASEIEKMTQKDQELQVADEAIAKEKEEADNLRRESEIALELIRQEKERAEGDLSKAQGELESAQNEERNLQDRLHKSEMQFMDLDYKSKSIHERLQQTYHLNLNEFKKEDHALEFPAEELDEKLEKLRKRVESIGTVNLLAIEEYDELKERYDFLMKQQNDLEEARNQLLETIRKINRTTKSLFEETFKSVQLAFQEYYETLFNGGQAKLVLVDESNPLESGIDIIVRPPGKKLQHISLLSGGEKAMTAIALLLALFKIKPSPYCVLDEVDAPLDEANVDRFVSALQTFIQSSQFIIVTHNRKTIAMGDSLYGVTMEEAGVSKIVSVKVAEEDDQTEEAASEEVAASMSQDEVVSATEDEPEI